MLVATDRCRRGRIKSCPRSSGRANGAAPHTWLPISVSRERIIAFRRGHLRESEAYARWSLEQKLARGTSAGRAWHLAPLLDALVAQGDLDGAEHALAQSDVPRPPPAEMGWALVLEARGRLRLAQGRPADALDDLLDVGRRWEQLWWSHPGLALWRVDAARAMTRLGDHAEAATTGRGAAAARPATGLPRLIAGALLAKATTAQRPEGIPLLQQAVDLLEPLSARLDLGSRPRRARSRPCAGTASESKHRTTFDAGWNSPIAPAPRR